MTQLQLHSLVVLAVHRHQPELLEGLDPELLELAMQELQVRQMIVPHIVDDPYGGPLDKLALSNRGKRFLHSGMYKAKSG